MFLPSRTSSQRSRAWRKRGCVTCVPACQNVPARSSRSPICRIFSSNSGVRSIPGTLTPRSALRLAGDLVFGEQLLLLEPTHLDLFGRGQGSAAFEELDGFVEAPMFCGQFFEDCLLGFSQRDLPAGAGISTIDP